MIVDLLSELHLNRLKEISVQNGRLFTGQDLALEVHLSNVKPVAEQVGEGPSGERDGSYRKASLERALLCDDTTPRPILLLKQIIAESGTVLTRGSTFDNSSNLAPKFLKTILRKYGGTRLGRQELEAELLEQAEGSLWKRALIERLRVAEYLLPPLIRIVVAIDPNASSAEDANECGIVCAGLGENGHAYVLDDISGVFAPNDWASRAIGLHRERRGDRIIAEINNGGEMVENTLRMVDPSIPYSAVWASRGKVTRAEPVSALYEQGRVHHVGPFPRLEDQMCAFTIDFDRKEMGYSPDRVDALVWALTELMIEGGGRRRLLIG
ncbi:MAG: hypothetical protein PSV22_01550 [Pseudolabrys sp.]|nr:hypothetical protein [Pseudolabrys sp.]